MPFVLINSAMVALAATLLSKRAVIRRHTLPSAVPGTRVYAYLCVYMHVYVCICVYMPVHACISVFMSTHDRVVLTDHSLSLSLTLFLSLLLDPHPYYTPRRGRLHPV